MRKIRPRRDKALQNAAFAAKFPRRLKKHKRKARRLRTAARELAWLQAMGIERDPAVPLMRK